MRAPFRFCLPSPAVPCHAKPGLALPCLPLPITRRRDAIGDRATRIVFRFAMFENPKDIAR
jgi:hypothetical protein